MTWFSIIEGATKKITSFTINQSFHSIQNAAQKFKLKTFFFSKQNHNPSYSSFFPENHLESVRHRQRTLSPQRQI